MNKEFLLEILQENNSMLQMDDDYTIGINYNAFLSNKMIVANEVYYNNGKEGDNFCTKAYNTCNNMCIGKEFQNSMNINQFMLENNIDQKKMKAICEGDIYRLLDDRLDYYKRYLNYDIIMDNLMIFMNHNDDANMYLNVHFEVQEISRWKKSDILTWSNKMENSLFIVELLDDLMKNIVIMLIEKELIIGYTQTDREVKKFNKLLVNFKKDILSRIRSQKA